MLYCGNTKCNVMKVSRIQPMKWEHQKEKKKGEGCVSMLGGKSVWCDTSCGVVKNLWHTGCARKALQDDGSRNFVVEDSEAW